MRTITITILSILALSDATVAATITVRRDGTGDFTTIQPALDAASPGDTIDIGPGDYTEFQTIRPPGYSWEIDIYGFITTGGLTIQGAGADQTLIGPVDDTIDIGLFSPTGIWAHQMNHLDVRDLTVRNCYTGIYGPAASLNVVNAEFSGNSIGIFVVAGDVNVNQCIFWGYNVISDGVYHRNPVAYSRIRDCVFVDCQAYYDRVEDFAIEGCEFIGGNVGITVYNGSVGAITNSVLRDHSVNPFALVSGSSICCATSTAFVGSRVGLYLERGAFTGESLSVIGTTDYAIVLAEANAAIHGSDILPAGGYAVLCTEPGYPPSRTYDMTGNYWGLTENFAIADMIYDAHDDPSLDDYVLYIPFAGSSVETEATTWGAVKSLFGGQGPAAK